MPLKNAFWLSLLLTLFKLLGFYLSGSMIVLASFYDSMTDSFVSYLNSVFFHKAREKADPRHPFGHGAFEVMSSLIQGVMICTLGLILAWQSSAQLLKAQNQHFEPAAFPFSLAVMVLSAISGYGIQWYLGRYEKRLQAAGEPSLTVSSDRAHYLSDFAANGLGAVGLCSVFLTGNYTLDSALGLCGAFFLFKTAWPLLQNSIAHIMQVGVEADLQHDIHQLTLDTDPLIEGIHRLRARRMGPSLFVDFHLKLPAQLPLAEAHALGERVEERIRSRYPTADVLIHLDPDDLPDEADI